MSKRLSGPVMADEESRRRKGNLNAWVCFDILLAVRAIVRNGACCEIDLVANRSCLPGGGEKFRKRALPGLVGAQRRDEGSTVECGTSTVPFATGVPMFTTSLCSVRYKL